jgi:peptide subunit release factor RF-3
MELEKNADFHFLDSPAIRIRGFKLNLLDTPGHKDFSEDTYRVLRRSMRYLWSSTRARE